MGSPADPDAVVGVDVGVASLVVVSTGGGVANPKPLGRYAGAWPGSTFARSEWGGGGGRSASKRSRRTRARIARCHAQATNLRTDVLHKLTTRLATTFGSVVVEDNVAGMTSRPPPRPDPDRPGHHRRNGARRMAWLNRTILDAAPGELRRQLAYKCRWYGSTLVVADRFYPSSKTCSVCRTEKTKLSLTERTFCCEACGLVIDRDHNAARNLAALVGYVAASGAETQNGRGGERSQAGDTGRCSPVNRQVGASSQELGRTGTAVSQGMTARIGSD